MFTGRRLDILDNGSLKLQYNRNRYYDQYTGRFFTHDPLGITPDPQGPNIPAISEQYNDGVSLYEYANSSPVNHSDPFGLWGNDMHYWETYSLATSIGFKAFCANKIATGDHGVDFFTPATNNAYQKYHFNGWTGLLGGYHAYPEGCDEIAKDRWGKAQKLLEKEGCNVYRALYVAGQALHGFQDAKSHVKSHHADTAWKHVTGPNLFDWHRPDKRSKWKNDWNDTVALTREKLQALWANSMVQCVCKKR